MKNNPTYLADWFDNKISDEDLKQYISEADFLSYQKIKHTLKTFSPENADLESNYKAVQHKIQALKTGKKKVISLWKYASVAATLLLFMASYFYFSKEINFTTGFGEKKSIVLSDHSKVILNSKSELTYSNFFTFNRTLELDGEAFFEVEKGRTFTVQTKAGTIQVLGTQFNVISNSKTFLEVHCFEGSVTVTSGTSAQILKKGENIRFNNNQIERWTEIHSEKPTWFDFESSFKNTPLKQVFEKINNEYGVEIVFPKEIENTKFTGTITHKDINTAMQSICIPLRFSYKRLNSNTIEIQNE